MLAEALAPIFFYTVFGIALRAGGIVKVDLAPTLFRFIFVATLPLLVFTSISRAPLDAESALLPIAGFLTNAGCGFGAYLFGRWRGLSVRDTMALVLSSSIINMMLMFPFVLYGIGVGFAVLGVSLSLGRARIVYVLTMVFAAFIGVTAIKIARRKQIEQAASDGAAIRPAVSGRPSRDPESHETTQEPPEEPSHRDREQMAPDPAQKAPSRANAG